jgi:hypothetical protein
LLLLSPRGSPTEFRVTLNPPNSRNQYFSTQTGLKRAETAGNQRLGPMALCPPSGKKNNKIALDSGGEIARVSAIYEKQFNFNDLELGFGNQPHRSFRWRHPVFCPDEGGPLHSSRNGQFSKPAGALKQLCQ